MRAASHGDGRPPQRALQRLRCLAYAAGCRYLYGRIGGVLARLKLAAWGAEVGSGLWVRGRLRVHNEGRLVLGNGVRVFSGPANYVGGDRRMSMWVGRRGELTIGDGCALSNTTIVCLRSVAILPGTFVGGGCEIYDTDFHPLDPEDRLLDRGEIPVATVRIGPKAFVGGFSIILKGVTIGEGAVVGAGSVVTGPVGPYEIWGGAPARFIRWLPRRDSPDGDHPGMNTDRRLSAYAPGAVPPPDGSKR